MKAVVDTNVFVSGIINATGGPGKVIDLIRTGIIKIVIDDRIFEEYTDVLSRDFLKPYISKDDYHNIVEVIKYNSIHITSSEVIHDLPHKGDIPFLEVAITAEAPLITGNSKHFPEEKRKGCQIYTPAEFLKKFTL